MEIRRADLGNERAIDEHYNYSLQEGHPIVLCQMVHPSLRILLRAPQSICLGLQEFSPRQNSCILCHTRVSRELSGLLADVSGFVERGEERTHRGCSTEAENQDLHRSSARTKCLFLRHNYSEKKGQCRRQCSSFQMPGLSVPLIPTLRRSGAFPKADKSKHQGRDAIVIIRTLRRHTNLEDIKSFNIA